MDKLMIIVESAQSIELEEKKYKNQVYLGILAMYLFPFLGIPGILFSFWAVEAFLFQKPDQAQIYFQRGKILNICAVVLG